MSSDLFYFKDSNGRRGIGRAVTKHRTSASLNKNLGSLQLPTKAISTSKFYDRSIPFVYEHDYSDYPGVTYSGVPVHYLASAPRRQRRLEPAMSTSGDFSMTDDEGTYTPQDRHYHPQPRLQANVHEPRARATIDSIPLDAAARQLYGTITRAITFFDGFYRSFRTSTEAIRQHAGKALLNSIWQSRIRSSTADPTMGYNKHRKGEQNGDDGTTVNPPSEEHFSFREHQRQVLRRMQQLVNAQTSKLPAAAALFDDTGYASGCRAEPSYHDKNLYAAQQQHRAADLLRRKVRSCYEDVKYAVDGMSSDYEQAKLAVRELKYIRQYLVTTRKSWDRNWSFDDFDGGDSDGELAGGKEDVKEDGANGNGFA